MKERYDFAKAAEYALAKWSKFTNYYTPYMDKRANKFGCFSSVLGIALSFGLNIPSVTECNDIGIICSDANSCSVFMFALPYGDSGYVNFSTTLWEDIILSGGQELTEHFLEYFTKDVPTVIEQGRIENEIMTAIHRKNGIPENLSSLMTNSGYASFINSFPYWERCISTHTIWSHLLFGLTLVGEGNSRKELYTASVYALQKLKDDGLLLNSDTVDKALKLLSSEEFVEFFLIPHNSTMRRSDTYFEGFAVKLVPTVVDSDVKFKVVIPRNLTFGDGKNYIPQPFWVYKDIFAHYKYIFTRYPIRVTLRNGRDFVVTYNRKILERFYSSSVVDKYLSSKLITPYYIKFRIPTIDPLKGLIDLDLCDIVRMEVESAVLLQDLTAVSGYVKMDAELRKEGIPEKTRSLLRDYAAQNNTVNDLSIDPDLVSSFLYDKANSGYLLGSELIDLAQRLGVMLYSKEAVLSAICNQDNSDACRDFILNSGNFSRSDILAYQSKFGTLYKKERIPSTVEELSSLLKTGIFKIERNTGGTVVVTNNPSELNRVLSTAESDDYFDRYESDSIVVNRALSVVKKLLDNHKPSESLDEVKSTDLKNKVPNQFGDWKPKYLGELYYLLLAKKQSVQGSKDSLKTSDNEILARDVRAFALDNGVMAVHDYYVKIRLRDIKGITRLTQA